MREHGSFTYRRGPGVFQELLIRPLGLPPPPRPLPFPPPLLGEERPLGGQLSAGLAGAEPESAGLGSGQGCEAGKRAVRLVGCAGPTL